MQPQRVSSVKTCLGANWDTLVCVLRLTQGPAGRLHANATKLTVHSCLLILIWAIVMQACSKELCWSTSKSFLKIDFLVKGKSSEARRSRSGPVFYYIVFLKRPRAWKQLSSWAILALTNRSSLMSSICKKTSGGKKREPVITEIKSYVYSVMPHMLWSCAKCAVLEGKQIAWPSTRLCLFLLLSLQSHYQLWALKTNVQLKYSFLDDLFLLWWIAGILCLIFRKSSRLLQGHVRSQDLSYSQAVLFPAAILSALGGQFTCSCAFFPLPLLQTLKHSDDEWWFLSQFDGSLSVFLSTKNPPFPLTYSHTHIRTACMEDKHIHVILYLQDEKKKLPSPNPI